jgi:hypothetical protein
MVHIQVDYNDLVALFALTGDASNSMLDSAIRSMCDGCFNTLASYDEGGAEDNLMSLFIALREAARELNNLHELG